ncbi:MAG TPA: hypothetical protein VFD82_19370 [Planctomycetota bacterium]|nr:hypothetical protein [Planctomycetota bacterium]
MATPDGGYLPRQAPASLPAGAETGEARRLHDPPRQLPFVEIGGALDVDAPCCLPVPTGGTGVSFGPCRNVILTWSAKPPHDTRQQVRLRPLAESRPVTIATTK